MTNEPLPPPLLITGREAARLLGISFRTLFTMTKRGDVPRVSVGRGSVRYSPDDLRAYIDRQTLTA